MESAPQEEREFAFRYLNTDPNRFVWDMIRGIWSSVAVYSVTTMQDLLNLGTDARMNFPSKLGGNWEWRMTGKNLNDELARSLRELNGLFLR
jgi:4-alpha-glucanotransferase